VRLPDFVIIGAAKAGTTSLYRVLSQHPDIFMSTPKEPEFFARDDIYSQGIDSYARLFESASPTQLCGEASTLYSLSPLFPLAATRIRQHVPNVKLIYVLREPVARAYSYYLQQVKNRQNATQDPVVHRSFEECLFPHNYPGRASRDAFLAPFKGHLPDDPALFIAGSDYPVQIGAYLAHFERSQMHFVLFEDLMSKPTAALAGILDFLGLDPNRMPSRGMARDNISDDHFDRVRQTETIKGLRNLLGPLYAPARLLPAGVKKMTRDWLGKSRITAGVPGYKPLPMQPETRAFLESQFNPSRKKIEALTGLDLAAWDCEQDRRAI
jgi:hypothetical protein